jgi:DNA invertase Pin-like site-specific DNA recombinase
MSMKVGYARVSTQDQQLHLQVDALQYVPEHGLLAASLIMLRFVISSFTSS